MDADVRGDVVPLDDLNVAGAPPTCKIQVVGTLATNMSIADVVLFNALAFHGAVWGHSDEGGALHRALQGCPVSCHS